jgi:hypothetical protein
MSKGSGKQERRPTIGSPAIEITPIQQRKITGLCKTHPNLLIHWWLEYPAGILFGIPGKFNRSGEYSDTRGGWITPQGQIVWR